MSRDRRSAGVDRMFRSPPALHSSQPRGRSRGSSPSQREDRGRRYSPKSDCFARPRRTRDLDYSPPRSHERNLFPPRTQPPLRALERRHSPPRVSESYYPRNRAIEHPFSPPRASKQHYSPNRAPGLPYSPPRASKVYYSPNRLLERPYSPAREKELNYSPRRERERNYSPRREREHFYSPRRERERFYSPPSRVQEQKQSPPWDRRHNRDYVSPMRSQNREFIPTVKEREGRRVEYFHDLEQSRRMERKDAGLDFGELPGVGTSTSGGGERWHGQPQSLRVSEGDSRHGDRYGGPSDSRRKYGFTDALAHSGSTSVKHQFSNLDDHRKTDILNGPIDHGFSSAKASGELGSEGRPYLGSVDSRAISAEGDPRRVCSSYEPRSLDIGDPPRSCGFDDGGRYASGQHNLSMKLHSADQNPFQGIQQLDKSSTERQVLRDIYMETGTLDSLRHSHYGSGYVASSSHPNAFTNRSPTELRNGVNSSFGEDGQIPLDGRRTFVGRLGEPIVYDHDSVIRSPNGNVDDIGIHSDLCFTPTDGHRSSMRSGILETKAPSNTRPSEFYSRNVGIVEDYSRQNVSRACILDPVRSDDFSYREIMTENKPWDCVRSSQVPSKPGYFEASGALDKGRQEMDILEYDGNNPIHKRVVYKGYRSASELHGHGMDGHPSTFHEKSGVVYRDHNLHLDEIQAIPKSSTGMFKRKHGRELNIRSGFGTILSSHGRSVHRIQERDEGESSVPNSKKMKANHSKYGKNIKKYNMPTRNRLHSTTSIASRLSKVNKHGTKNIKRHGTRDIKKRLGPQPQDVETSHSSVKKYKSSLKNRLGPCSQKNRSTLPWMKNLTLYKESKDQDDLTESLPDQGDDPLESSVTPLKNEPLEDSEDFKQLVHNAFFKFVKHLNETPARRRKYMKQGTPSCLKCIICGRESEEFEDVESLVKHALTSTKAGVRSQHLGFHKALCVLMGWKSAENPTPTWVCEALPKDESLALKDDLIIWPPVVVIHNVSLTTNSNPDEHVVVSVEELEAKLKDMGFGGHVYRGKPVNQSVLVVKFAATLSGLEEAERLSNVYAETKHGRAEFQQISSGDGSTGSWAHAPSADKMEDVLFGHLGIVEDVDKLDFETKKRSKIKSKKEIQNTAVAPMKRRRG